MATHDRLLTHPVSRRALISVEMTTAVNEKSQETILITGATGTIGRQIVAQLVEGGQRVRALSRNPAGSNLPDEVEIVYGDLTRPETLGPALENVAALHLITFGGDESAPLTTGRELVDLANKKGVRRVSVLGGWEESSVEQELRESGLGWTLLRPVEFMANALEWAESVRTLGVVRVFGNAPSAVVHEADIAAVAVKALLEDGHSGQAYTITGPQALTPAERVRILGEAIGRDIGFEEIDERQERERLRAYGWSDDDVEFGIELRTNPPLIGYTVLPTVERVTGKAALDFSSWAAENAGRFSING